MCANNGKIWRNIRFKKYYFLSFIYYKYKGVTQAINKNDEIFTKEDEGFLSILSNLAGTILKNTLQYDEQQIFHTYLRHLLKVILFILIIFYLFHEE